MKMKFIVEVSTNKTDPQKLDVSIKRPSIVAKKWGSLALLTHMGIAKGLQEAYKVADGEIANAEESNGSKE